MGDITNDKQASSTTRIVGRDEVYAADVVLEDGLRKLAVSKLVQVEDLSGIQEAASNWFSWEEVSQNDTLRIEIAATDASPALDVTFTVQAGEDRFDFASRIVLELNQDFVNFQPYFRAVQVNSNSIIFIEAKTIAEAGSNEIIDSFKLTGTGTLALTLFRAFDNFVRRTSTIQAAKSSKDPRIGIFGVEGTVESRSADVGGLFVLQPYRNNDVNDIEMNVDGLTPQTFTFPMDALNDIFVTEIRFFGLDNGIQFENFLGRNTAITNGIEIEIKSDNEIINLPLIKTTEDFADKFAFGGGDNFQLYIQSGVDKFLAAFLSSAFPLRRTGTFGVGNDDYIKITIQDNLTAVTQLQAAVVGFVQEA